jgi:hypothetical protein
MNISRYSTLVSLDDKTEIQKCLFVAFYIKCTKGVLEFEITDLMVVFDQLHYSRPNTSRLKKSLLSSKDFIRGSKPSAYKIHGKTISRLEKEVPEVHTKSEEIVSEDTIIPELLYSGTRGFVESLSKQINASYQENIFDGCAVLMRRLLEILLILSYEKLSIEAEIKNGDGSYKMLNGIASNAKNNSVLNLSRNSKDNLENFRLVGNFSAHKIYYNAKRRDISSISQEYRATIEELMYKSELIK